MVYICNTCVGYNNIFIRTYDIAIKIRMIKFYKIGKHCKSIETLHSKTLVTSIGKMSIILGTKSQYFLG